MREKRGITLIALVITIIVLIILAGVSINLILGQNGIINKAKQGAQNYEIAQREENMKLDYLEGVIEGTKSFEEIKQVEYVQNTTFVEDKLGNKFVIPKGFKIAKDSGETIEEGIVIEDNDIIEGIGNNRRKSICMDTSRRRIKES